MSNDSIYVIAGEMSGDQLGARLISSMRNASSQPMTFYGVGGCAMKAVGISSLFPMKDLSVMGFGEVVARLPKLIKRINQCVSDIVAKQPRVVVTIDSPGFCFRVVEKAKKKCPNTKFVHYVAPQVWAWKPKRAEKVAHMFDGLMCLLPFEPRYFTPYGLRTSFVGHQVIDLPQTIPTNHEDFYEKYDLSISNPPTILSVLFGSREGEVTRLGQPLFAAAYRLLREWPNLAVLVPTAPHLWDKLKPIIGADQRFIPVDPEDRYEAFHLSSAAIATSGTVGLELAMLGVPHVVAYRLSMLNWQIAKRLVHVPHMHLVNLILNERVVPEFLQKEATGLNLSNAALGLLVNRNGSADRQRNEFDKARHLLTGAGEGSPADQAARFVLEFM